MREEGKSWGSQGQGHLHHAWGCLACSNCCSRQGQGSMVSCRRHHSWRDCLGPASAADLFPVQQRCWSCVCCLSSCSAVCWAQLLGPRGWDPGHCLCCFPTFHLLCVPIHTHLHMYRCMDLSSILVCWVGSFSWVRDVSLVVNWRCETKGASHTTRCSCILQENFKIIFKTQIMCVCVCISYSFSSSHVWIWEPDNKEGWVLKNWCFWTVGLEKTLESPLNYNGIKPANPKGNQPWTFLERTDAEAEAPILWPSNVKSWLIRKDLDAGKDWGQEGKGVTKDEMVGWHHRLNGHKFEQSQGDSEGQRSLAGSMKSQS